MNNTPGFIFAICQTAATATLRTEVPRLNPGLSLAFSQPGFVTFKLQPDKNLSEKFHLKSTLARTFGWVQQKYRNDNASELVTQIAGDSIWQNVDHLHIFQRDEFLPGEKNFEPGATALADSVHELFQETFESSFPTLSQISINQVASADQKVLDIIIVAPNEWWVGYHFVTTRPQQWIGGVPWIDTEHEVLSRAYFKLQEALLWSGFQLQEEELCVEIGSATWGRVSTPPGNGAIRYCD